MKNPDQEYDRLHDHMTAIARERDNSNRIIKTLEKRLEELEDELVLAHEALARRYTRP
jgi:predicted  nucleic acid-binding Zn-ribbon protein